MCVHGVKCSPRIQASRHRAEPLLTWRFELSVRLQPISLGSAHTGGNSLAQCSIILKFRPAQPRSDPCNGGHSPSHPWLKNRDTGELQNFSFSLPEEYLSHCWHLQTLNYLLSWVNSNSYDHLGKVIWDRVKECTVFMVRHDWCWYVHIEKPGGNRQNCCLI